jgi:hypothetical protein
MNTDRADTGLGGFLLGPTTGDCQGEGKKELKIESGDKYGKQMRRLLYLMLEVKVHCRNRSGIRVGDGWHRP